MCQQILQFQRTTKTSPVDLSRADFGPELGYNFRTPIQVQPRGFAYRYGRPANKLTVGEPLCQQEQFQSLPLI